MYRWLLTAMAVVFPYSGAHASYLNGYFEGAVISGTQMEAVLPGLEDQFPWIGRMEDLAGKGVSISWFGKPTTFWSYDPESYFNDTNRIDFGSNSYYDFVERPTTYSESYSNGLYTLTVYLDGGRYNSGGNFTIRGRRSENGFVWTGLASIGGQIYPYPANWELDATFNLNFIGEYTGPVPEPATWAMMVAGVGLTGAMMRRRRTTIQLA